MRHRYAPLIIGLAAAVLTFTAAAAQGTQVKVSADSLVVEDTTGLATFSGNVLVTREDLDLRADRLLVEYGDGGPSDIRSFTATGNVRIRTGEQQATGNRATFNPQTQILRLFENVTVTTGSGTVNGPELTINLVDNTTEFKGNAGSRVTGVFTPQ